MDWQAACGTATECAASWAADEPGGVVLVFDRDGRQESRCGGQASLEGAIPFGPDTPCRWASITKHLFATLILGREGGLDLDDPLGRHIEDLHPGLRAVTIGRGLDMTGGLPDVSETMWLLGVPFSAALDRGALATFVQAMEGLNFPAGTQISYSNTGYRLAEAALHRRGIGVMAALRHRFGPLVAGMDLPEDWSVPVPGLATGYFKDDAGWHRTQYGLQASASGGLTGSASDLARWLRALLRNEGATRDLLEALSAPRRLADGRSTDYGLGLRHTRIGTARLLGHGALLPGFCGHFLLDPDTGLGVIVLSNRADTDPFGLASRVMAAGLGTPLPGRSTALPSGLFVGSDGAPIWIETEAGQVTVIGTTVPLYDAGDGVAESGAAQLPVRLRASGDGIAGSVAHVERAFRPVAPDAAFDCAHDGLWHCSAQNAWLRLAGGSLEFGAGPLRARYPLRPLGPDMALWTATQGPWRLRGCVQVEGDRLRLVSERSRCLTFCRAG